MRYRHQQRGVCSRYVEFDLDEKGIVSNISFFGGCNGNLNAISKLCEGQKAEDLIRILKGNDCGGRGTSCADQFAMGLELALQQPTPQE